MSRKPAPRKLAYTFAEAATATGLSARTVRRLCDKGILQRIEPQGVTRALVDAASVEAWLMAGKLEAING